MTSRLATAITTWRTYRRGRVDGRLPVIAHPTGAIPAAAAARLEQNAAPLRAAGFVQAVVELTTRFADGSVIGTLNTTMPPIFDRPPWLKVEVLPGATVAEMPASHRPRVAAVAAATTEPWDEDPLTTATRENEAVLAYQAERGVLAEKDGDYGYTGRGAVRSIGRVARAEPDQSSGAA